MKPFDPSAFLMGLPFFKLVSLDLLGLYLMKQIFLKKLSTIQFNLLVVNVLQCTDFQLKYLYSFFSKVKIYEGKCNLMLTIEHDLHIYFIWVDRLKSHVPGKANLQGENREEKVVMHLTLPNC